MTRGIKHVIRSHMIIGLNLDNAMKKVYGWYIWDNTTKTAESKVFDHSLCESPVVVAFVLFFK